MTTSKNRKTYWVVWNDSEHKCEGVIFDNEADARWTAGENVKPRGPGVPSLGSPHSPGAVS